MVLFWLALAVWAAFLAAHLVLSGRSWLWAVPDMVPPPAFVAVPLALLVVFAVRGSAPGALAAALLAVIGLPWSGFSASRVPEAGPGPSVTVFVWNTEYWDQHEDTDAFIGFLCDQDADVYLLQEYVYWDDAGLHEIPAHGIEHLIAALPGHEVFVRGEFVTAIRRALRPRLVAELPDTALRTDVYLGTARLALWNVHLPVPLDLNCSMLGRAFSRALRHQFGERRRAFAALAEGLRSADVPVVVGGDFNASPAIRPMRAVRAGYGDLMGRRARPFLATWPARPSGPMPRWPRMWRLDWLLCSSSVRSREARLVDPAGHSDHVGQLCELVLPH